MGFAILSLQQCSVMNSKKNSLPFAQRSEKMTLGTDTGNHICYLPVSLNSSKAGAIVERNVSGGFEGCSVISPHDGHDNVTKPRLPRSNSDLRSARNMALEESSVASWATVRSATTLSVR